MKFISLFCFEDRIPYIYVANQTTTAAAFTVVPRHVMGGMGYTAPSNKLKI